MRLIAILVVGLLLVSAAMARTQILVNSWTIPESSPIEVELTDPKNATARAATALPRDANELELAPEGWQPPIQRDQAQIRALLESIK